MLILQQPDENTKKSIYDEFNTTAESVRRDALILKEWMEKQPHLPNVEDETFLANWLLRCKNSLETAKNRLEGYYTLKALMPCIYANRDPFDKSVERSWKAVAFVPLPKPSPDGCRVSIFRIFDPSDAESHNSDDVLKIIYMGADLRVKIDCIRSDILIFDFKHFTMPVTTIIMGNIRRFITPGTKGVPMRYKTIYILNAAPAVESLIALAKSFVRKDLTKKVIVLKDSDLTQVLPKEILPVDYGGEERSTEELRDGWLEALRHHNDWFVSEESVKADNTKRITPTNSQFVELALEGSFRRITVD